ncbi:MAG: hypothetical protein AB1631_31520 [Acidobacteriota bacterium]
MSPLMFSSSTAFDEGKRRFDTGEMGLGRKTGQIIFFARAALTPSLARQGVALFFHTMKKLQG